MENPELVEAIQSQILVNRPMVMLAKNHIASSPNGSLAVDVLEDFLRKQGVNGISKITYVRSLPIAPQVKNVADLISWQLAFMEAVWALTYQGVLLGSPRIVSSLPTRFDWSAPPGSSHITLDPRFHVETPKYLIKSPSLANTGNQVLADDDLYLTSLEIVSLHPGVTEFIRQAIVCFRNDLYIPCLAMLGAANEGAWHELGLRLIEFATQSGQISVGTIKNKGDKFTNAKTSTYEKINMVVELYEMQNIFKEIARVSFTYEQLRLTRDWAHDLRILRNAIHYSKAVSSSLTYDQVAVRLLSARNHLRTIYSIFDATTQALQPATDGLVSKQS